MSTVALRHAGHVSGFSVSTRDILNAAGFIGILSSPVWGVALFFSPSPDFPVLSSVVLVPMILLVNFGLILSICKQSPELKEILSVSLMLKTAAAGIYLYMCFRLYHGSADTLHYYWIGEQIATNFKLRGEWTILHPIWGTNFICMVTGALVAMMGNAVSAAMLVYASISFWGQYFFYRVFCTAFPQGNRERAASLIFLLPSIVFWSAAIGKDALTCFSLGLASYGFVLMIEGKSTRGALYLLLGVALTGFVRPHMAGLFGLAVTATYIVGKHRGGTWAFARKIFGIPLLVAGTVYLVRNVQVAIGAESVSQGMNLAKALAKNNMALGGSTFGAGSLTIRLTAAPLMLFRPFPWEIHNIQAAVASLEALFLLCCFWRLRHDLRSFVTTSLRHPFVLFIIVYWVEFTVVFGIATTNFGILSRMRIMLLPLVIMLLCVEPPMVQSRRRTVQRPR